VGEKETQLCLVVGGACWFYSFCFCAEKRRFFFAIFCS